MVLRDLSFQLRSGRVLGLLGRTGSGKTTITRLIFRLYDPAEGVIRLGGEDIRLARLDDFLCCPLREMDLALRVRRLLGPSWAPGPQPTGSRSGLEALVGESPSFLRLDLFARYSMGPVAPYARVENLADRRYAEVDGYPAPRRRFAAGIEARF